ncbi:MAG: N-acyl homoserine lactonase family protein [Pseudomonadota bacterium]
MADHWQVWALKYAERNARVRGDSFIFDDHPAAAHGMDYFIWLLQRDGRTIVVDTGYDGAEAERRERPILRHPGSALGAMGVDPATVDTVIVTHLHYDHAGGLDIFPNANFHLQVAEMAFATGPCMCHDVLRMPFTGAHVAEMVMRLYAGRVVFHDGSGAVAPGVRVHRVGGHSRGLQVVEVETPSGPLCLASDAAHYYENFLDRKPFPIVADLEDMLTGFDRLLDLGRMPERVIPGHDPLVTTRFAAHDQVPFAWRLDPGPARPFLT